MQDNWQTALKSFLGELEKEEGFFELKSMCEFLLKPYVLDEGEKPYVWKGKEEVAQYISDYLSVSEADLHFHSKWQHIGNMKSVAVFDKQQIIKIKELLSLLS
jgi:hypothetical protein